MFELNSRYPDPDSGCDELIALKQSLAALEAHCVILITSEKFVRSAQKLSRADQNAAEGGSAAVRSAGCKRPPIPSTVAFFLTTCQDGVA
jgi:hypothetical protein